MTKTDYNRKCTIFHQNCEGKQADHFAKKSKNSFLSVLLGQIFA